MWAKFHFIVLCLSMCLVMQGQSIYDFKIPGLEGGVVNFADFKGKKILIVNTASKCGFTPQYEGLEKLYQMYKDKGLVVVGLPSNDYMKQEPGTSEEIADFCQKNYGVTFPMTEKIKVEGKNKAPLYKYLDVAAEKIGITNPVKWNFGKFLIDENGQLLAVFSSKTEPLDSEITDYLK